MNPVESGAAFKTLAENPQKDGRCSKRLPKTTFFTIKRLTFFSRLIRIVTAYLTERRRTGEDVV